MNTEEEKKESLLKKEEEERLNQKKQFKKDSILTLIGNFFHFVGFDCMLITLNLTTYLISYLREFEPAKNKSLTLSDTYFIPPIVSITMGLTMPFVGLIDNKIGNRNSLLLTYFANLLSLLIFHISKNYYIGLISFFIIGLGNSLSFSIKKNLMYYFFESKGTILGTLEFIGSVVSYFYNILFDKYIMNPNSQEPTVIEGENRYYTFDISKKLINVYRVQSLILGATVFLAVSFIVPYNENKYKKYKENKNKEKKKHIKEKKREESLEKVGPLIPEGEKHFEDHSCSVSCFETISSSKEIEVEVKKSLVKRKRSRSIETPLSNKESRRDLIFFGKFPGLPQVEVSFIGNNNTTTTTIEDVDKNVFKKAFKSGRVWRLFLMNIFASPITDFTLSCWRPIGIYEEIPTSTLQNIASYNLLVESIAQLTFGFLADKLPFRVLFASLSSISALSGFCFCFTFKSPSLFMLVNFLINIDFIGKLTIAGPHYMKVFGMEQFLEIGGMIGLARVFMSPICSFVATYIENSLTGSSGENMHSKDLAYYIMFISAGGLSVISLILSLFETEDEFRV